MKPFFLSLIVLVGVFFASSYVYANDGLYGSAQRHIEMKPSDKTYFVSPNDKDKENDFSTDVRRLTKSTETEDDQPQSIERRRMSQISKAARIHAENVLAACPENWENNECLRVLSDTYLTASALYAEDLDNKGHKEELENIKDHCAASTAATRNTYPAYAVRSAFVECSNEFYAIYERTKIMADQELSQLMVMGVLCLDKDPRCSLMEAGLKESVGGKN